MAVVKRLLGFWNAGKPLATTVYAEQMMSFEPRDLFQTFYGFCRSYASLYDIFLAHFDVAIASRMESFMKGNFTRKLREVNDREREKFESGPFTCFIAQQMMLKKFHYRFPSEFRNQNGQQMCLRLRLMKSFCLIDFDLTSSLDGLRLRSLYFAL